MISFIVYVNLQYTVKMTSSIELMKKKCVLEKNNN